MVSMKTFETASKSAETFRPHSTLIPLQGCKNLRDLGGFVNTYGQTVRKGLVFRSGHLHNLSDHEVAFFREHINIKEIIDLRTPDEISEKPDRVIPGIAYEEIPIVPKALAGITRESGTDVFSIIRKQKKTGQNLINAIAEKIPDITTLYASIICDPVCQEQFLNVINAIFARINKKTPESILFHCTIGKDRCGLVSMLLLSLLGVSRKDIIADYLSSNRVYKHKARKYYYAVLVILRSKHIAVTLRDVHLAKSEYIIAAIDSLLKLANGKTDASPEKLDECAAWYMTDVLGVPSAEIARFRSVMLV